jgi:hypothetical protein
MGCESVWCIIHNNMACMLHDAALGMKLVSAFAGRKQRG